MPSTITHNDFSAGWTPSDDQFKGRQNGLPQMDNVELDKNGALSLSGGCSVVQTGFTGNAHTLYSRVINGVRKDYAATADGKVYRDATVIIAGGDATNAAFGTAFNYTLIATGGNRTKDSGVAVLPLGITTPATAPTLSSQTVRKVPNVLLLANLVDVKGTSAVGGGVLDITLTTEADGTGAGVIQSYAMTGAPLNWNIFDDGGFATANDLLYIRLQNFDPINDIFRIDFLLVAGNASGDSVTDIYSFFPPSDRFVFNQPVLADFCTLTLKRSDFNRIGNGTQSWTTVYGFRIVIVSPVGGKTVTVTGGSTDAYLYFIGGANTQNGTYQYAQIDVNNTGSYLAKSQLGPASVPIYSNGVQNLINYAVPVDTQVNEVWLFRRSYEGIGLLDQWYRIKKITIPTANPVTDVLGDQDALTLDIKVNTNLITVASTGITDKIFDIIGPIQGRWLYFTTNFMYPSDIADPDLVDSSLAVRITGSASELFLWARAVSDSAILVGTSIDVYLLTGTFATLPDNSVDIYYRPLGCKFPPITCDAVVYNNAVFYLAMDGWRSIGLGGGNPLLVAPNTDQLYTNNTVVLRSGSTYSPAPLRALPVGTGRFPIVISNNKMYCFIRGTGRCEVYDFIRQYWRTFNFGLGDVTAAFGTQDGWVLAFYGTDKKTRLLETQSARLIDNTSKQTIGITTPVFDGGTPQQRKDSYTLKLRGYTGGAGGAITIKIVKDDNSVVTLGSTWATGGVNVTTTAFDISSQVDLTKTFQIYLTGTTQAFVLEDISIEVDVRPIQVSFLRVQAQNYGTSARKRFDSIPFQIDTLGNSVLVTPFADTVAQPGLTVVSSTKKSFTYEGIAAANEVTRARDWEYTLSGFGGSLFEFFGFGGPRNMEVFPEPRKSHIIPVTNFGTASKKRIRVWPFVLDPLGGVTTFTPIVDGVAGAAQTFSHTGKLTVRFFFKTDVFGVDYSGCFSTSTDFELWEVLSPDNVQTLPIARQFDQVGPQELFKYGRIKQFEIRVLPFGGAAGTQSSLPYTIYFNDSTSQAGSITVDNSVEKSYFIGTNKGVAGEIVRIELGPTDYDFHRYYMRVQCMLSGKDTELEWVPLMLGDK